MLVLAEAYANGTGVPRDPVKSKRASANQTCGVLANKGAMFTRAWEKPKPLGDKNRIWMQHRCIFSRVN